MFLFTDRPGEGADFRPMPGWLVGTVALWAAILVALINLS
jgi:hypothetical protein